jgi:hypothetical protein
MKEEDYKEAFNAFEQIIKTFNEDYELLINGLSFNKDKTISIGVLQHISVLLSNETLNRSILYSDAERNYISHVKKAISERIDVIRNDKDPLRKGRLTPEQTLKYSTDTKPRPPVSSPPTDRNIKEGRQPDKPWYKF